MRGTMEEVIEPAIAIALALILAFIMGAVAYVFLDILGRELTNRHPTMLALQFAGITSAVASAPQGAVYCHRIRPVIYIDLRWKKASDSSLSTVLIGVREYSATSRTFQSDLYSSFHVGPMPQPYPVNSFFDVRKNVPIIIAMQKKDEQLNVFQISDMSECDFLV
jgi:hypothetical protein